MTGARCDLCGDVYRLEVLEFWIEERTFLVGACCEGAEEDARATIEVAFRDPSDPLFEDDRREIRSWFERETGISIRGIVVGEEGGLRYGNGGFSIDFGLELVEVSLAEAKAFVAEHHRHNRPPVGWRWGHGLRNGGELVAVAMVGRPVARMIPGDQVVEVNRLCVDPGVPAGLARYACSKLYAAAARQAKRRGFRKVITYTLETERGASVKAAGFVAEAKTRGGSWSRPSRRRGVVAPTCRKVRWARTLRRAA